MVCSFGCYYCDLILSSPSLFNNNFYPFFMKQILLLLICCSISFFCSGQWYVNAPTDRDALLSKEEINEPIKYDTIKIVYTFVDTSTVKIGNYDGYRSTVQMWAYGYEVRIVRRELTMNVPSDCPTSLVAIESYENRYTHYAYLYLSKKKIPENIIITWYIQLK